MQRLMFYVSIAACCLAGSGCGPSKAALAKAPPGKPIADINDGKGDVQLLIAYLARGPMGRMFAMAPSDRRPAAVILADLMNLPEDRKEALRSYILKQPNLGVVGLEVGARLIPGTERTFLLEALKHRRQQEDAITLLAKTDDPTVVPALLSTDPNLALVTIARPSFHEAVLAEHRARPSKSSALVIGAFGPSEATEIRKAAETETLRNHVLTGLAHSEAAGSARFLVTLVDPKSPADLDNLITAFARAGVSELPLLKTWLVGRDPFLKEAALKAMVKIKSPQAVLPVLNFMKDVELRTLAGQAAASSPDAVLTFIEQQLPNGSKQAKLNALLLAHHLPEEVMEPRTIEHPLVPILLQATRDRDPEVRLESLGRLARFAYAGRLGDTKALRRFVQMFGDKDNRVRAEAILMASQYPSYKVLALIEKVSQDQSQPPTVLETAQSSARSLKEDLSRLRGSGRKIVDY
jgi:HEAT repeat protein